MFKKIVILLLCVFAVSGSYAQDLKFGHLDTQNFIANMPETKEVLKKLEAMSKKYEDTLVKMQEEFRQKYTEFAAQADTMLPVIRERKGQELNEMEQRISNLNEEARLDIQKQQEQLISPIQDKVRKAIKEIAEEQGMIYVFDTAVLLHYSPKSVDIAPLVKKKLNIQ